MASANLSERERISLLMMRGWGDQVRSYLEVRTLFNNNFRNEDGQTPISKATVERTVRHFAEHGTISNLQRTDRPTSVVTEEKQIEIAQAFIENPHFSLRRVELVMSMTFLMNVYEKF